MKLALAQINPTIADLEGNVELCLQAIRRGGHLGADLVILPEMALTGYPPRDILFDASFVQAAADALHYLAGEAVPSPPAILGSIAPAKGTLPRHPSLNNAAFLVHNGLHQTVAAKRLLPVYDVFYEPRWFLPGEASQPLEIAGQKIGVLVCEDLWDEGYPIHPGAELAEAGAQLLVSISASPYRKGILEQRLHHARRQSFPVVYLNRWGADDELIFDGQSFVTGDHGQILAQMAAFQEDFLLIELEDAPTIDLHNLPLAEEQYRALVLGVRDFARKNELKRAALGLSGGVDSSVVAVIAANALGPENVTGIANPSRYTDPRSTDSARQLAATLGMPFEVIPIEELHSTAERVLNELLAEGTAPENIQARLRMMIWMAYINHTGGFLLNTSNKSELALGYSTLYGDMAGSLCPIADLHKPEVYALARWINREQEIIPAFCLERAPSAELRAEQVDPFDYDRLTPQLDVLIEQNRSNQALRQSEHKRWSMGVILKVSEKAFGTGRMIPITRK